MTCRSFVVTSQVYKNLGGAKIKLKVKAKTPQNYGGNSLPNSMRFFSCILDSYGVVSNLVRKIKNEGIKD